MKKRFSEEQKVRILQESDAGAKVKDVCAKYNVSDATFYAWKKKYGGLDVAEARRQRGGQCNVLLSRELVRFHRGAGHYRYRVRVFTRLAPYPRRLERKLR